MNNVRVLFLLVLLAASEGNSLPLSFSAEDCNMCLRQNTSTHRITENSFFIIFLCVAAHLTARISRSVHSSPGRKVCVAT